MKKWNLGFVEIVFVLVFLAGCVSKVPPRESLTTEMPQINKGEGRIYFCLGKTNFGTKEIEYNIAGDLFINNQKIGYLNKDEYIVVDLLAGSYEVYWVSYDTMSHTTKKNVITLKEDERKYMQASVLNRTNMKLGLIGALTTSDFENYLSEEPISGREKIKNSRLVEYLNLSTKISSIEQLNKNENTEKVAEADSNEDDLKSVDSKLGKLKNMYENKLITKEEYDAERKEVLDKM